MDTKYTIGLLNASEGIEELRVPFYICLLLISKIVLVKEVISEGNQCAGSSVSLAILTIRLSTLKFEISLLLFLFSSLLLASYNRDWSSLTHIYFYV